MTFLNINKEITSITGGAFEIGNSKEILFIGSRTNLLAYDINENTDKFDVDVSDGVNCLHFTKIHSIREPLVIAGGNCSITGFDSSGNDTFWTVAGDNVRSLESVDIDFDGQHELIVGSDDYSIRMFKHEELIFDIKETATVSFLSRIERAFFGFGLGNSTLGVYNGSAKKWKIKCDNTITALKGINHDINGDY